MVGVCRRTVFPEDKAVRKGRYECSVEGGDGYVEAAILQGICKG